MDNFDLLMVGDGDSDGDVKGDGDCDGDGDVFCFKTLNQTVNPCFGCQYFKRSREIVCIQ